MAGRNCHSAICCWALIKSNNVVTSRLRAKNESVGRNDGRGEKVFVGGKGER